MTGLTSLQLEACKLDHACLEELGRELFAPRADSPLPLQVCGCGFVGFWVCVRERNETPVSHPPELLTDTY